MNHVAEYVNHVAEYVNHLAEYVNHGAQRDEPEAPSTCLHIS